MYDIVVGRPKEDVEKGGTEGTIYLGKHYIQMGRTMSLSNKVLLDVASSHVVLICGKRGGGKSYTMGVIAEGLASLKPKIASRLSFILVDTMGIYWTMKYPNKKDEPLLNKWNLKTSPLDVQIFTPSGFYKKFKDEGIPTDHPFAIKPSELDPMDWCTTFDIHPTSPPGVLLERVIFRLKDEQVNYGIDDIIKAVQDDKRSEQVVKDAVENEFLNTKAWGVFDKDAEPIKNLAIPGKVTVLDVSCYATMPDGWKIKAVVVGVVSKGMFIQRMLERREEEFSQLNQALHYFDEEEKARKGMPLVWLVIDEAHELLPREGKTVATDPLVTILREGRQPGVSLILATQQPGKIHTDVMTQADTVISHRITAKIDTDALGVLMQSYMREGLDVQLDALPRVKGAALIFDDTNERLYPIQVRPRFTWHGGAAPTALSSKKQLFDF